jgi:hypothetical protein
MNKHKSHLLSRARVGAGFLILQVLLLISFERPAKAYVDPGSGALIWQGMLAALVGSAFYFRRTVHRIKTRFFKTRER